MHAIKRSKCAISVVGHMHRLFRLLRSAEANLERLEALTAEVDSPTSCLPATAAVRLNEYQVNLQRIRAFASGTIDSSEEDTRGEQFPGEWCGEALLNALCSKVEKEQNAASRLLTALEEKVYFLKAVQSAKVIYVSNEVTYESIKEVHGPLGNIYILFFNFLPDNQIEIEDRHSAAAIRVYFLQQAREERERAHSNKVFVAVDLDVRPTLGEEDRVPRGTRICLYTKQSYSSFDLLNLEHRRILPDRLAFRRESPANRPRPDNRDPLDIPSVKRGTVNDCASATWHCAVCGVALEYGSDNTLYCECGGTPAQCFQVDYGHPTHTGLPDFRYEDGLLQLKPLKEVNVIVMAQKHVGRSSWLNTMASALQHAQLSDALRMEPRFVASSAFWTADENFKSRAIYCEPAITECDSLGVHTYRTSDTLYRFFDLIVPMSHVENRERLCHMRRLLRDQGIEEINSLCIVVKSNASELSVNIGILLSELKWLVTPESRMSVCVCLTHSRETSFRPGDVLPSLRKMFQYYDVDVTLSPDNVFCTDSEPLRYICTVQQGIALPEDDMEDMWQRSVKTTHDFLDHVSRSTPWRLNPLDEVDDFDFDPHEVPGSAEECWASLPDEST